MGNGGSPLALPQPRHRVPGFCPGSTNHSQGKFPGTRPGEESLKLHPLLLVGKLCTWLKDLIIEASGQTLKIEPNCLGGVKAPREREAAICN